MSHSPTNSVAPILTTAAAVFERQRTPPASRDTRTHPRFDVRARHFSSCASLYRAVLAILSIGFALGGSALSAHAQGRERAAACAAKDGAGNRGPLSDPAQATTSAPPRPPNALAGAWGFSEGAGTQTSDASGNGGTGILAGNTSWLSAAKHGAGLSFDGSGVSVQIPNSSLLDIGGTSITISFWAWVDAFTMSDMVVLAKPWTAGSLASPPYQYGVEFGRATRTANFYFGSAGGVPNGPFAIPLKTGTWAHIAFTYDGSFVRGYRDGAQVVSVAASGSIVPRGNPIGIGTDSAGAKSLKGRIDDLRIYSRALLAAEIQSDMKTGVTSAADLTPPGSVVNLHRTDTHP